MIAKGSGEMLVDTHAHLCDAVFEKDLGEVLQRAQECGVSRIIAVSETMSEGQRTLDLADRHTQILPAVGLYPKYAHRGRAEEVAGFIRREQGRLAAIGEVGLDFRLAESDEDKELQQDVFSLFIQLSLELDLPLNVHSRSAGKHAVKTLLEQGARRVQMHAFDGKAGSAAPAVEAGYFFSVPPSVTRSRQKQKLLKQLPLSCLLLETDSPVLGPSPTERNEPRNLVSSLRAVAEIKNLPEAEVREAVQENTRQLFGHLPIFAPLC
jgi:TatD DNase family protein